MLRVPSNILATMPKRGTIEAFFSVSDKRQKSNDRSAQQVRAAAVKSNDATPSNLAASATQQAMWGSAPADQPAPTVTPATPAADSRTMASPAVEALGSSDQRIDGQGVDRALAPAVPLEGDSSVATPRETQTGAAAAPIFGLVTSPAAPAAAAAPPTAEVLAQWHEDAARNLQLAEERVAQAKAAGKQPQLSQLLVDESWHRQLQPEFEKQYFKQLQGFLESEWQQNTIYPPQHMIFRAMNSCSLDKVKVVILGQDPYHGSGQAMGLSFSVPQGVPVPSSLQNIYKELNTDLGCARPKHGCLLKWAEQGVLLLNTCLTVRAQNANSHAKKGWESFTDKAIAAISAKRTGVVFLLWGRPAQTKEKLINVSRHHVLKCAHPSGLSANRGFFGCGHFSKANRLLVKGGMAPIDWQIE